ncbi:16S rRNA (guanine(527)-N(7))-methyltransferase RsmG [Sagittula salina]|uniref:Ribosomal RNA small subunit methyltransferase G n=1 Tax=Sagittula salina TaxID=2820268 RepID=A0A940MPA4_9RHOB|nr:16S rRNA (guanine(527)-N(7))-methyltransferase RsmG [Sagittula salina]MBP0483313.1 16S rRNA (guanine(527)-N(7))-methyltransferase RsmG [Sagittula salina]
MILNDLNGALDVSRETLDRLDQYHALLKKWNPKINLVSASTLPDAKERHFRDSVQVMSLIEGEAKTLVDMGSGGGFPGLVIAIVASDSRPDLAVTLIESDQRKASFLRTVLRETGTSASVLSKRIEQIDPINADVVTARALAPLSSLCVFAHRHLKSDGQALFLKGKSWGKEVEAARTEWRFSCTRHTSVTDDSSVILDLRDLTYD